MRRAVPQRDLRSQITPCATTCGSRVAGGKWPALCYWSCCCRHSSRSVSAQADTRMVVFGTRHAVALKNNGDVLTWGENVSCQLGRAAGNRSATPGQVLRNIKEIAAASAHTLALDVDGKVYAWGGDAPDARQQRRLRAVRGTRAGGVARGQDHRAHRHRHRLQPGGDDRRRSVLHGRERAGPMSGGEGRHARVHAGAVSGAAGKGRRRARRAHSTRWCRQRTASSTPSAVHATASSAAARRRASSAPVPEMTDVVSFAAGTWHSAAVRADGSAWVWGSNGRSELCDGTTVQQVIAAEGDAARHREGHARGGRRQQHPHSDRRRRALRLRRQPVRIARRGSAAGRPAARAHRVGHGAGRHRGGGRQLRRAQHRRLRRAPRRLEQRQHRQRDRSVRPGGLFGADRASRSAARSRRSRCRRACSFRRAAARPAAGRRGFRKMRSRARSSPGFAKRCWPRRTSSSRTRRISIRPCRCASVRRCRRAPATTAARRFTSRRRRSGRRIATRLWTGECGVIPQIDRVGGAIGQISIFFNRAGEQFVSPNGDGPKLTGKVGGYPGIQQLGRHHEGRPAAVDSADAGRQARRRGQAPPRQARRVAEDPVADEVDGRSGRAEDLRDAQEDGSRRRREVPGGNEVAGRGSEAAAAGRVSRQHRADGKGSEGLRAVPRVVHGRAAARTRGVGRSVRCGPTKAGRRHRGAPGVCRRRCRRRSMRFPATASARQRCARSGSGTWSPCPTGWPTCVRSTTSRISSPARRKTP